MRLFRRGFFGDRFRLLGILYSPEIYGRIEGRRLLGRTCLYADVTHLAELLTQDLLPPLLDGTHTAAGFKWSLSIVSSTHASMPVGRRSVRAGGK